MNEINPPLTIVAMPVAEPPESTPIRLNDRQVHHHLQKIKLKLCRVWHVHCGYLAENPTTRLKEWSAVLNNRVEKMQVQTYDTDYGVENYLCEMLDQEAARLIAAEPVKLCCFEQDLPQLAPLLKLCPNNPTYRGLLSQKIHKLAPAELTTYDQLKEWAEFNWDSSGQPGAAQPATPAAAAVRPPAEPEANALSITVNLSDIEYGTARYSVPRSCRQHVNLTMDEIAQMIRNCGCLDDLMRAVKDFVIDDAWEYPDMEYGDYEYDSEDASDTDDSTTSFPGGIQLLQQRLLTFLQQNATREQLEQLGLDTPF